MAWRGAGRTDEAVVCGPYAVLKTSFDVDLSRLGSAAIEITACERRRLNEV